MKNVINLLLCFCCVTSLTAQNKVTFVLKEKTVIRHDSIYVTGTFSNWDSTHNKKYLMQHAGENVKSIVLDLPKGTIRYKYHRGDWLSVEKQNNGLEVADRIINITGDTTLTDIVSVWRDEFFKEKKYALIHEQVDTSKVTIMANIAQAYAFLPEFYNSDSALFYANEAYQLQQKILRSGDYKAWSTQGRSNMLINLQEITASLMHSLGNYPKALELRLSNLALAEKGKDDFIIFNTLVNVTTDFASMKDYANVLRYGYLADSITRRFSTTDNRYETINNQAVHIIADAYYNLNNMDSTLLYANRLIVRSNFKQGDIAFASLLKGNIYAKKGDDEKAFYYYRLVYPNALQIYNPQLGAGGYEGLARLFKKQGRLDSALSYARNALALLQDFKATVQAWGENTNTYVAEISPLVAELYYANGQPDSAYKYLQLSVSLKDSLYNTDKIRQFQTLTFNETGRRRQLDQQSKEAQRRYQTKLKMYGLIAGMVLFLVLAFVLYRNNIKKQKANNLLEKQKEEIRFQRDKVEKTYTELQATQGQLIQSEKMASLGELTAGIAHEIQNPLNFVNNFSEVSNELIDEMNIELDKGDISEAKLIASDIKQNLEKINHHGKRADAIVKGMLQHSRSTSGVKESTDINALCDEYLRLSYHGLRAKDKSFNATMKTDFDNSIANINIIPQDIGRVVLNLLTNAFYVVDEKKKAPQPRQGVVYDPTVSISTKKINGKVEIRVSDNGNGIPQKVLDKIFQPFFTTKPTGQGTGLGLSLSYDIVKAHGGEIKVETQEGAGTTFIIQLPVGREE